MTKSEERISLVAAAVRVSEFKADLIPLLGNTPTAGEVYMHLGTCLQVIQQRITNIDRKALEGAIESWR